MLVRHLLPGIPITYSFNPAIFKDMESRVSADQSECSDRGEGERRDPSNPRFASSCSCGDAPDSVGVFVSWGLDSDL
jgi:hypothetical protein